MAPTIPERLATLEAEMKHSASRQEDTKNELSALRAEVRDLKEDISEIKDVLTQARGGWKAMIAIGTIVGFILSGAGWVLNKLWPFFATLPR